MLAAAVSRQVTPCWNIPVGAQGVEGLRAELHIQLRPDGGVQSVEPTDPGRMEADPAFRTFAESAVRAVRACAPLKLPPEQYQVWRNIIFNFDASLIRRPNRTSRPPGVPRVRGRQPEVLIGGLTMQIGEIVIAPTRPC